MQTRKALGKGLASLIPSESIVKIDEGKKSSLTLVDVNSVIPNRLQPRKNFDGDKLNELADSIKQHGLLQPVVVTPPVGGRYELVAGERRLRAAKIAGLEKVPVIIMDADTEMMLEFALIENIQRDDLNPLEEAEAYKELIDEFGYTQEEVADKVAKSRPHVANSLRLLYLPKVIQEDVMLGRLSAGHARTLLSISKLEDQLKIREIILHSNLTVRDVEKLIQDELHKDSRAKKIKKRKIDLSPQIKAVLHEITAAFGTKVRVIPSRNNKGGQIIIDYYSIQDLNRIYRVIVSQ